MADLISEIIAQEAFDQVKQMMMQLNALSDVMDKLIAKGAVDNKMINASDMKAATDATANLNSVTNKLIETESERLNIERQIKAEGEKMAAAVKIESNAVEEASKKYKMFANSQKELSQYIIETERRLSEIKDTLKAADSSASNYVEVTSKLKIEQAKLKSELAESTKELKRTVTEQKYADDSMKGMSVRLTQLKDIYSQFTEEERNSDFGKTISAGINELDDKLKGLDKSIGDNQRNVGNYEVAGKSLKAQLKEIVNELAMQNLRYEEAGDKIKEQQRLVKQLATEKGKESQEYMDAVIQLDKMEKGYGEAGIAINQLQKQGGKLKDIIRGTNEEIARAGEGEMGVMALQQGVGAMADTYSVFQAGMVAVGAESEDLIQIYAKMQLMQQGVNSITSISNALQKESMLMLQIKAIRQKVSLAFTQKQTAAEVSNTVATAGAATATGGLAAAETVATKTSWTLTGALKSVGAAIKSIPVVGWILAAGAALGTLTVLLYKHVQAERELTIEQVKRKQIATAQQDINQKANESTLETVTRVRMLQKELGKVKQGSSEYRNIVGEINKLTGQSYDTLKATPNEISKGTKLWIEQYKIRAKAEATIQQIVQNQLEFEKLSLDIQRAKAADRKGLIDQLPITQEQKDLLLEQLNIVKGTVSQSKTNVEANKKVMMYLNMARDAMNSNNSTLESSITLEGILGTETGKTAEGTKSKADNTKKAVEEQGKMNELEKQLSKMKFIAGEQENRILQEKIRLLKEQEGLDIAANPENEIAIRRSYQLQIAAVTQESSDIIIAIEENKNDRLKELMDERIAMFADEKDKVIASGKDYLSMVNKLANADNVDESEKQAAAISSITDSVVGLGLTKAQYIKDEKQRVKVEQGLALVQVLITQGIVLAQMSLAQIKADPYTYVPRLVAAAAAIVGTFITAIESIKQANSVAAYAEGTAYHKGGAAIVGEGGEPELVKVGGRSTWITEPTFIPNLPIGASVTPLSDLEQTKNMNDYWLEKIANGERASVNIDVSGRLLPTLIRDGRVIRFANKIITARG